MKLDSVRSLKAELRSGGGIDEGLVFAAALPASVDGFASALPRERPPRPMALGVTGKGGDYKLAVRVQSMVPGLERMIDDIRQRARGEVDVRMVGEVVKQQPWHRRRQRPLLIGGSIGHRDVTAGTLGCFVTSTQDDTDNVLVLSNNHVLADEDRATSGDDVLQPGPRDHGQPASDAVAELTRFVSLSTTGNRVDAAIAELEDGTEYFYRLLRDLGEITGVRDEPLDEGDLVYKIGRSTGLTRGRVSAIEVDELRVRYDRGLLTFDGQIEITPDGGSPFSLGGDSGAIIVDRWRRAVALLFAGNDVDATYANPIGEVISSLGVQVVH